MWSKNNSGMTLIEVMVAMFILAIMTILLQQITNSNLDSIDRVEKRDAVVHSARVAMRRLVMDLANAFIVAPTPAMQGLQSGNPVIETRFNGQGHGGRDQLSFTTFSHLRYVNNVRESDQSTVSYFVENDKDDHDNLQLLRREAPSVDVGSVEKGTAYAITDHLKAFTLQYLDIKTNEWRSDWDSKDTARLTKLPRAVKIQIDIIDPNDKDNVLKFSTIALVQLWQMPIDF
ncbi:MAG: hypothetical protein COV45_08565 [Deltaproteobacteria bacterium CG11_big_fil_rev_8_21_14_0_20_47_16]|nr:MAG: hypothetical protein COV45_08565 [Deltaproteobacteria bacterium CG11_big_fil_rev_8_21_14_0_20_47_16]